MSAAELYQKTIVDHAKGPRNAVLPRQIDASVRHHNPVCGDRVDVGVLLRAGVIREVGAVARGCALCVASGSIMTELVHGANVAAVRALARRFAADLAADGAGDADDTALGALVAFRGIRQVPSRRACAMLPWDALLDAIARATGSPSR